MPEPAEPRNGVRFPRHLRRPALAAGALVGVLAAAAVLSFRCDGQVQPPAAPGGPYEVPTIRVRLTAQPVRSLLLATTGGYRLTAGQDVLAESSGALPPTTVAIVGGAWRIGARQAAGDEIVLAPAPGSYLRLGDVSYRGTLRLRTEGDGQFVAINHADLEVYLAGVLPKELLASWHRQTYRALARQAFPG